jgi:hypothetical protein
MAVAVVVLVVLDMEITIKVAEVVPADMVIQAELVPMEVVFMRKGRLAIVVEVVEVGFL